MRIPVRATTWLLLLLVLAAPLRAQDPGIYAGEAAVTSQDEAERLRVLPQALTQALVKASGDSTLVGDPGLPALLGQAPGLLQRFSYRQELEPGPGGVPVNRTWLVAQFDPSGVENILVQLRRPIWGANRPPTLVWLVIDDGVRKTIASAAQVGALGALTRQARERGIALRFPQMDADEAVRVDPQALWNGGGSEALAAARRYRTPAVLVARLARSGGGWSGRFTLADALGSEHWTASYPDSNGVLIAGAAGLADRLARRFAVSAADRQVAEHRLWIRGLDSASDYGRVLSYLGGLSVVSAVEPEGADGDRLLVRVTLTVGLERLRQLLAFADVLAFDDAASAGGEPTLVLAD